MPVTNNVFSSLNTFGELYQNYSPVRARNASGNIVDGSGVSAVSEGYIPLNTFERSSADLRIKQYKPGVDLANPNLTNFIFAGRSPLLQRTDYYPIYNWDKANFTNFNKLGINRAPVSSVYVNASAFNQNNTEILDNTIKVDIPGVSSTIRIHFGRRPAGVQQIEYIMNSYNTSAYVIGRSGGDTGMALNFNERWFINSSVAADPTETPGYIGNWWHTSGFSTNPTRGGGVSDLRVLQSPPSDQSWHPSFSLYRNYQTGTHSNGITSGIFDSTVIPFDFISFSGEGTTVTNMDKGGDPYIPTVWKNLRMHERVIVNYSGIEGVICHQNWSYQDVGFSAQSFGKTFFTLAVGPILPIYFDKTYAYNATRKTLWDMDSSVTGGLDGAVAGLQPFSSTVDKLGPSSTMWHRIIETDHYPKFLTYLSGVYLEGAPVCTDSDWASLVYNNRTYDKNLTAGDPRDAAGSETRWVRPAYFGNNTDGNIWNKGTFFFDLSTYAGAHLLYVSAISRKDTTGAAYAQSLADNALFYSYIMKKSNNNFANATRRPFIASGPFAVGILAKGDTNFNNLSSNFSSSPSVQLKYMGNGCSGDWNSIEFSYQNFTTNNHPALGFYDSSANAGSPEVWMGYKGMLVVLYSIDYWKRLAGWNGSQYFMVLGKDEIDVKNKIDFLVSSGIAKTRPTFSVPKFVQDGVKPPRNIVIP